MRKLARARRHAASLALGVAACGDDDDDSGGRRWRRRRRPLRQHHDRRLEHCRPVRPGRGGAVPGREPGRQDHGRHSGTGGGFEKFCAGETDISDASRPIEADEEVPICKKGGVELQGGPGRQRRHRGRDQQGRSTVDCLTTDQLKKIWDKGSKVKNYNEVDPKLPDAEAEPVRPRHRLRHLRLLHRRRSTVRRATRARTTSPPRTTTCSSRASSGDDGRPRLLRLLLLRAEPGQAEPGRRRRRRRLRQAEHGDDPGRQLQAAVAAAVHVPERQGARAAAGEGLHGLRAREPGGRSRRRRKIVPMTPSAAGRRRPRRRSGG